MTWRVLNNPPSLMAAALSITHNHMPNASFGRTPKYSSTTNELRTPTKHMAIEELNHRYNREYSPGTYTKDHGDCGVRFTTFSRDNRIMGHPTLLAMNMDDRFCGISIQSSPPSLYDLDSSKEFLQIEKLKTRKSGFIFHCLHRLDGFDYAITKIINHTSKREDDAFEPSGLLTPQTLLPSSAYEPSWLLTPHSRLPLSAYEPSRLLISQSLLSPVPMNPPGCSLLNSSSLSAYELSKMLTPLFHPYSLYIHALNLAHLNLKSATVLIQKEKMFPLLDGGSHGNDYAEKRYTYKIGDTGHVTNIENPKLEKGDFRYLPREIQKEDFSQVTRADIFSLGPKCSILSLDVIVENFGDNVRISNFITHCHIFIHTDEVHIGEAGSGIASSQLSMVSALTLYEAATLKPLPENGPVWHSIRDSHLDEIEHCDQHFNDLLKMMVHSDPSKRPSAATILSDQYNFPLAIQSKSWLIAKLQEAQQQKDLLTKRIEEKGISLADTVVEKHTPLNDWSRRRSFPELGLARFSAPSLYTSTVLVPASEPSDIDITRKDWYARTRLRLVILLVVYAWYLGGILRRLYIKYLTGTHQLVYA
uniref:Protein kinase domain-containing protein n=1 Tax=Timema shepardi TaxID=629360 RepID=A0A7R9ANA6_TIMSH|nr:unnamed protein product [Timema shepardi]